MPPTLAARWITTSAPVTASRVAAGSRRSCSAERMTRTCAPRSSRSRVPAVPRKPAPPVTVTALPCQNSRAGSAITFARAYAATGHLVLEQLDVVLDHDPHQVLERRLRLPSELGLRLARIAVEGVDLGRAQVARVELDVLLPVHAQDARGLVEELAHAVGLPGGDHVVVRLVLLEHHPHRLGVVGRVAPVALGIEVAHVELLLQPEVDGGQAAGDLARDERLAAALALVVEEDAVA